MKTQTVEQARLDATTPTDRTAPPAPLSESTPSLRVQTDLRAGPRYGSGARNAMAMDG